MKMNIKIIQFLRILKKYQKILLLLLFPAILSILPILIRNQEGKCAYVVILMCFFWLSGSLPIAVTSLFPVVFFPLFSILSSGKATSGYFQDIVMLFFGTLVVADAIEQTRLHERIALRLLTLLGTEPKWLLLGFMGITGFLSLWISNAAATSIMLPIVDGVVKQLLISDPRYHDLDLHTEKDMNIEENVEEIKNTNKTDKPVMVEVPIFDAKTDVQKTENNDIYKTESARKLATGFFISCAYSAIIGGVGTLVGTAPNLLIKGYFTNHYPDIPLNFLTFTLYGLPIAIILMLCAWIWLTLKWLPKSFCKCGKKVATESKKDYNLHVALKDCYNELGPITWAQGSVGLIFILLVLLWITREFGTTPGWSYFFQSKYISDTTPAILAVLLIFVCPRDNIFKGHPYRHLIEWNDLQKKFPWNIILLCGGALVMAQGFDESGLSVWLGSQLKVLATVNKEITVALVIVLGIGTSEFASNMSIAAILLPIIDALSNQNGVNPVYFLLPLTMSVSLAFMLPMGTPNMAIVYTIGQLKMKDMLITGAVMNILSLLVIFLASNTWLYLIFDMRFNSASFKNTTFPIISTRV